MLGRDGVVRRPVRPSRGPLARRTYPTDRSSRPKTSPRRTKAAVADTIAALRRQRLTGKHIAKATGVSEATVSRVLARAGLSRLKDLEPAEPVRRYEREHPR